ncbi:hypothetical protein HDU91_004037, partial [Kappamyces sp. JEL0680]
GLRWDDLDSYHYSVLGSLADLSDHLMYNELIRTPVSEKGIPPSLLYEPAAMAVDTPQVGKSSTELDDADSTHTSPLSFTTLTADEPFDASLSIPDDVLSMSSGSFGSADADLPVTLPSSPRRFQSWTLARRDIHSAVSAWPPKEFDMNHAIKVIKREMDPFHEDYRRRMDWVRRLATRFGHDNLAAWLETNAMDLSGT